MELQIKPISREREERLELEALRDLYRQELSRRQLLRKVVRNGVAIGTRLTSANFVLPSIIRYLKHLQYLIPETEENDVRQISTIKEVELTKEKVTDKQVSEHNYEYIIQLSEKDRNLLERILFLESSPFQLDATPFGAYVNAYRESLRNMLSVIENRVNIKVDEKNLYSNSWRGVLTQKAQFSPYTAYPRFCEKNSQISLEEALIMRRIPEDDWNTEEERQQLELKLLNTEVEDFLKGVVTNNFPRNVTVYVRRDILQGILAYWGYSRKDVDARGKEVELPVLSFYPLQIVGEDPVLLKEKFRHVYLALVLEK